MKLTEGDIELGDSEQDDGINDFTGKRNAVRDRNNIWHTRDIAYTIREDRKSPLWFYPLKVFYSILR